MIELREQRSRGQAASKSSRGSLHRSVYLPLLRGLTPTSLEVFDFAEQGMVTGSRDTTTVATQALYLLNDPFVRGNRWRWLNGCSIKRDCDDAGRIDRAYRLTLRSLRQHEPKSSGRHGYLADYEAVAAQLIAQAATPRLDSTSRQVSSRVPMPRLTPGPAGPAPANDRAKEAANGDVARSKRARRPAARRVRDRRRPSRREHASLPSSDPERRLGQFLSGVVGNG